MKEYLNVEEKAYNPSAVYTLFPSVDYTGPVFENINFTYTTEGVYYPALTVTDDQGNAYTDSIAIIVLNTAALDALLQGKWEAMKTALAKQDINTALDYYTKDSREHYKPISRRESHIQKYCKQCEIAI